MFAVEPFPTPSAASLKFPPSKLATLTPAGATVSSVTEASVAVVLGLFDPSSANTGASFTAVTVTLKFSVNVLTFGFVLEPLSVTVMLMLPVPFALAKVL